MRNAVSRKQGLEIHDVFYGSAAFNLTPTAQKSQARVDVSLAFGGKSLAWR